MIIYGKSYMEDSEYAASNATKEECFIVDRITQFCDVATDKSYIYYAISDKCGNDTQLEYNQDICIETDDEIYQIGTEYDCYIDDKDCVNKQFTFQSPDEIEKTGIYIIVVSSIGLFCCICVCCIGIARYDKNECFACWCLQACDN